MGDHQPALDAGPLGEERRQAGREMRINEACGPPLGDRRQLRDGHRGVVERQRQRLTVEVAAADHLSRREDEWVVGRRVDLDAEDALELGNRVAGGAMDLRHASEAVGVLHPVLAVGAMRRPDLTVASSSRRCLADATCPGCGRAAMSSSAKAAPVPSIASRLIAPTTSAVSASRLAS